MLITLIIKRSRSWQLGPGPRKGLLRWCWRSEARTHVRILGPAVQFPVWVLLLRFTSRCNDQYVRHLQTEKTPRGDTEVHFMHHGYGFILHHDLEHPWHPVEGFPDALWVHGISGLLGNHRLFSCTTVSPRNLYLAENLDVATPGTIDRIPVQSKTT